MLQESRERELIETLWNVNNLSCLPLLRHNWELIETLWNVNEL